MIVDIAAGAISIRHRLYGPNYCTVSACASSNTALINAFDTIRLGKASIMVAGGSEAAITPSSVGGLMHPRHYRKEMIFPKLRPGPLTKTVTDS
ncbi:MAG: beta-ketoacyl synthase N-terminal-like domain-containing protein, partial [Puia sp.]